MTDWSSLRGIYGSAEQVPALLAAAASAEAETGDAWSDLWTHLYHQGTVCSASYAALPSLAWMSRRREPRGYMAALHLAAVIVASTDGPEDPAVVRERYERELADLHVVAVRNLPYATSDTEFVYALEALMAFEDGGVWQRNLFWLANDEAEIDCPYCDEHLLLNLEGPDYSTASFASDSSAPTAVVPVEHSSVTVEGRLLTLARANDRPAVADRLRYLFGRAICPHCREAFHVPQALS